MEGFHLPHGQVSLQEHRIFHGKVPSKLYSNSKLHFLVNFNFVLTTPKRSHDNSKLSKGCSRVFHNLFVTILTLTCKKMCSRGPKHYILTTSFTRKMPETSDSM